MNALQYFIANVNTIKEAVNKNCTKLTDEVAKVERADEERACREALVSLGVPKSKLANIKLSAKYGYTQIETDTGSFDFAAKNGSRKTSEQRKALAMAQERRRFLCGHQSLTIAKKFQAFVNARHAKKQIESLTQKDYERLIEEWLAFSVNCTC